MAPKKNYTKEQMAEAIEEVKRGVNIGVAATKYGVPRITLRNKVTGKSPIDCTLGPATILTKDEETVLVQWLFTMGDSHKPVSKDNLLDSVQKIIIEKKLDSCPFKDNRPGKKWLDLFLKRHPEISERLTQNLTKARDDVSEDDLKDWFESIRKYLEEQGLLDVLNDPNRIFNADESAFYLQPKTGKVLVRKGEKNVYNTAGDEKENLTALLTANAAGTIAPPMIVYPYERVPALIANGVPNGWGLGRSETGWMTAKTFYEYITNVFNPWLIDHNVPKPVLLFLDGHRSHLTLHLANFCKDNGIEIIALYPNSTHLIQPMDVAIFRPLKMFWKNQTNQWKIDHPGQRFKKEDFAPNLEIAVKQITKETIKNGFRKSGLFPFSVDYVDMSKLRLQVRASSQNAEETEKAAHFITYLETEIKNVFTPEKLILFNQLYYMNRTEMESMLPKEDQSLYIIWAKVKHTLTGTESLNVRREALSAQKDLDKQTEIITPVQPLEFSFDESILNSCLESDFLNNLESNEGLSLIMQPHKTNEQPRTSDFELTQKGDDGTRLQMNEPLPPPTKQLTIKETQLPLTETRQMESNDKAQTPPTEEVQKQSIDETQPTTNEARQIQSTEKTQTPTFEGQTIQSAIDSQRPTTVERQAQIKHCILSIDQSLSSGDTRFQTTKETTPQKTSENQKQSSIGKVTPFKSSIIVTASKEIVISSPLKRHCVSSRDQSESLGETHSQTTQETTPQTTTEYKKQFSMVEVTPFKSSTKASSSKGMVIPSPFKRALFWPEIDVKKRPTKERLPSAITSECWRSYMEKKENEKIRKQEEKEKKIAEREQKKILKEKVMKEKKEAVIKKKNQNKNKKNKKQTVPSDSSSEDDSESIITYQESEYDVLDELENDEQLDAESQANVDLFCVTTSKRKKTLKRKKISESDSDDTPLAALSNTEEKGRYVIVLYEGEYFPGIIENVDGGYFEVSTMTLSKGNTYRWPDAPDKIWYKKSDLVEYIETPIAINKRGFYRIQEMLKYLPFIE